MFTRNHFPGAPVVVGRERLRAGRLQALVVNSKVSNVATGEAGVGTRYGWPVWPARNSGFPPNWFS
jgi:glutamate N-acetyltransferase / amino-acid N-acetyltransferase